MTAFNKKRLKSLANKIKAIFIAIRVIDLVVYLIGLVLNYIFLKTRAWKLIERK